MSFKVLLADDSAAIKKVVQLSLQDFGAEIKSVGSGKDVLDVCRAFKPDIAFVDVLLPHKTGYEVVSEIKKDAQLKQTPVVMLWSAFLAFDENKFKASGAEEKLEKPFEVSTLRGLVTKLVPKLSTNPVAKHLEFPKVDFDQPIGAVPPPKNSGTPLPTPPPAPTPVVTLPPIPTATSPVPEPTKEEWSMASFDDIGSFTNQMKNLQGEEKPAELSKTQNVPPAVQSSIPTGPTPPAGDAEEWIRKDVTSRFKVPVPVDSEDENSVAFQYSESEIRDTSFLFKPASTEQTSIHSALQPVEKPKEEKVVPKSSQVELTTNVVLPKIGATAPGALSETDLLRIQQETRDAVEKIVWKLVPEIASQIIREEIQRLLGDEKVNLRELVQSALKEDIPREDVTTDFLDLEDHPGKARLVAKQDLILSGREVFELVFRELEPAMEFHWDFDDADAIQSGKTICNLNGTLVALLKGERTALNFLGHLSGIATLTGTFVAKMKGTKTKIIDTRKTTPNLRKLEKAAVRHGGGTNHRAHLSERILVKENHIRAAGSISEVVKRLRSKNASRPIEIEVTSFKEIDEALSNQVEQVLLDNMSNDQIKQAVKQINGRCLIEASGNMTLDRVESVAKLGVDFISVGKLTHSAGSADVSLLFER